MSDATNIRLTPTTEGEFRVTSSTPFLFEKDYLRNLGRGHTGAAASAQASKLRAQQAREDYNLKPNLCKNCKSPILVSGDQKLSHVLKKKFCKQSCAASFNNIGHRRHPLPEPKPCAVCGIYFIPKKRKEQPTCGRTCGATMASRSVSKEELFRRGFGDPKVGRENRMKQLDLEEGMAEELRGYGWEIFSPTVVCDRIGIKDGKVFFLEFKPMKDQRLRPGQRRIADLVPEMYQIIAK